MEANPQPVITIYKKKGETPYEALMRLRLARPEYAALPLSYAGRLDPMAEGVLIVLVGEENKYREKYLDLEKTYKVQILFGIGTDTYDVLGKVIDVKNIPISETEVRQAIKNTVVYFLNHIRRIHQNQFSVNPCLNGRELANFKKYKFLNMMLKFFHVRLVLFLKLTPVIFSIK
jgi:tRNA pseudouridine(55) synthase